MIAEELHRAVRDGDRARVAQLAPDAPEPARRAALMLAIERADVASVEAIACTMDDVDRVVDGDFPLAAAARGGDVDIVARLLDAGAAIDTHCPVHWRRRSEEKDFVIDGVSALLEALRLERAEVLALLIERGAALNRATSKHRTPLDMCVALGMDADALRAAGGREVRPDDFTLVQAAQLGILARLEQADGEPPEVLASALSNAVLNRRVDAARLLVAKGARVKGSGALYDMAAAGLRELAEVLLAAGADPNARCLQNGELSLAAAAGGGHLELVALLIERGAELDAVDVAGLTALHAALAKGHLEVAVALIRAGADPLAADRLVRHTLHGLEEDARTAAFDAILPEVEPNVFEQLWIEPEEGDADPTAPKIRGDVRAMAAKASAEVVLERAIRQRGTAKERHDAVYQGADPAARDETGALLADDEGRTLLHLAASDGQPGVVQKCLGAGIAPDVRDRAGNTPLHWARTEGVVDNLVAAGADVAARNDAEETPLHRCSDARAVRRLLAHGADPRTLDARGLPPWTRCLHDHGVHALGAYLEADVDLRERAPGQEPPLHVAAARDQADVLELLLDADLDPLERDSNGDLAADVARKENQLRALALLVSKGADPGAAVRELPLEPKTINVAELLTGLEPEPIGEETIAALRAAGGASALLAAAIDGAPLEPYFDAVRERWCAPLDVAPAFRDYVQATLHHESLGDGAFSVVGAGRAQLGVASVAEALGVERLAGLEFPGLPVGRRNASHTFWLAAPHLRFDQRSGYVFTQTDLARKLAAKALLPRLGEVADAEELRLALIEGLQPRRAQLDIVDLVFLLRVCATGEIPLERALLAVFRWEEELVEGARAERLLDMLPL